jgi:hypothetical protein
MRSLEVRDKFRNLTNPGRKIEDKSKVQIPFPKIVCRFERTAPLFSPRIKPRKRVISIFVSSS